MKFQFSIRILFVITLFVAVSTLWIKWFWDQSSASRTAKQLHESGAVLHLLDLSDGEWYPASLDDLEFDNDAQPPLQIKLKRVLTRDELQAAARLKTAESLDVRAIKETVSVRNCRFSHLRGLTLGPMTDIQLTDWLRAAPDLRYLSMELQDLPTDRTFAELARMKSIDYLRLNRTEITAELLAKLRPLKSLRRLSLDSSPIEEDALAGLKHLPSLKSLSLTGEYYDDETMNQLHGLTQISTLDLTSSRVSVSGVETLSQMTHLQRLYLYDCQNLSKRCVPVLGEMQFLKSLDVLKTKIEKNKELRRKMGYRLLEWSY